MIDCFPSCPIPDVARLGRTLRAWRAQVLAYFPTNGVSNGGTEAINLLIEKTRRLAHGFRNFTNYRLRILLVAEGSRPHRQHRTMRDSEEPVHVGCREVTGVHRAWAGSQLVDRQVATNASTSGVTSRTRTCDAINKVPHAGPDTG